MVLHADSSGDSTWFEHDQRSVARQVLMNCAHLDPEVKVEASHRKLRSIISELDVLVPGTASGAATIIRGGGIAPDAKLVSTALKRPAGSCDIGRG